MSVIYGLIAAFCFYLGFQNLNVYRQRYFQGEKMIPNSIERETFIISLGMVAFGIFMVLSALKVVHFF